MYSDKDNKSLLLLGSPIRKSPDQRLFAPHRSLSQLTTSFIADKCLGILRVPLITSNFSPKSHHPFTTPSSDYFEGYRGGLSQEVCFRSLPNLPRQHLETIMNPHTLVRGLRSNCDNAQGVVVIAVNAHVLINAHPSRVTHSSTPLHCIHWPDACLSFRLSKSVRQIAKVGLADFLCRSLRAELNEERSGSFKTRDRCPAYLVKFLY